MAGESRSAYPRDLLNPSANASKPRLGGQTVCAGGYEEAHGNPGMDDDGRDRRRQDQGTEDEPGQQHPPSSLLHIYRLTEGTASGEGR